MHQSLVRRNSRFVVALIASVVLSFGCATTSLNRTSTPPHRTQPPETTAPGETAAPPQKPRATPPASVEAPPAATGRRAAQERTSPPPAPDATRPPSGTAAAPSIETRAAALLATMTLEEKIGQLFILPLFDRSTERYERRAGSTARRLISRFHPGGIILFGGNIDTINQTRSLVRGLQEASTVPLFIAVDEEGGEVSRLSESGHMRAVRMPAEAVVGATGDPRLAFEEGRYVGRELRSLGINMDLAPVADLDTNPANTVIGSRAFGSNPRIAAGMTSAMVRGLQSVGVSSVVKHFPGHGDTAGDSHGGPAVVHNDLSRLRRMELVPFEAGIAAGADGVMVGHLLLPEILNQKSIPASLSPYVIGELLRKELGFGKLVMTDALNMGAIADSWSSGTAATDAFAAGADLLLMPANPAEAFDAILRSVRCGEITQRRLEASVLRILSVKLERHVIGPPLPPLDPHLLLGATEGRRLVAEITSEAKGHEAALHRER